MGAAAAHEGAKWELGEDFRSVSHVSYLFQRVF
jgi:hypothetical protein